MQSSKSTARKLATAAILGAGSAALMVGTAHADGLFGASPEAKGQDTGSVALVGDKTPVGTQLTVLETAQGSPDHATDHLLWTYCIQKGVALDTNELYDEKGWDNEALKLGLTTAQLEGVEWLLNNSYPKQTDLTALATAAGLSSPATLTKVEAVEATQAAIWNEEDTSGKSALDTASATNDANVIALYKYLSLAAKGHEGDTGTPQLSLGISPSSASATAGDKIGPFTLTSSDHKSEFVNIVFDVDKGTTPPPGSKIVDASGTEVTPNRLFKDGDKVWVQIPADAPAGHIVLRASGQLPKMDTGRIFVTHDGKASQNLIVAASQNVFVRDYIDIEWKAAPTTTPPTTTPSSSTSVAPTSTESTSPATTPPTTTTPGSPSLAHTGADNTLPLAVGALALVAAGGGLVVYTRRRKQGTH